MWKNSGRPCPYIYFSRGLGLRGPLRSGNGLHVVRGRAKRINFEIEGRGEKERKRVEKGGLRWMTKEQDWRFGMKKGFRDGVFEDKSEEEDGG